MLRLNVESEAELVRLIHDDAADTAVKRMAFAALGYLGSQSCSPAMGRANHRAMRVQIMRMSIDREARLSQALAELGVTSTAELTAIVSGQSEAVDRRAKACHALGDGRADEAVAALVAAAAEGDPRLAWAASSALIAIQSRRASRGLARIAAKAENLAQREAAVYALGFLADRRGIRPLRRILSDPRTEESLRELAAEALSTLRGRDDEPVVSAERVTATAPPAC